jgi:hypothetical protein
MAFNDKARELINKEVFVVPHPGWGYTQEDGSFSDETPGPFRLRITELLYVGEIATAALGTVASGTHPLSSWWAAIFPAVDDLMVDPTEMAAMCGTLVCPAKPGFNANFRPTNSIQALILPGPPWRSGISQVSTSLAAISRKLQRKVEL